MPAHASLAPDISRRRVLKVGLFGSAFLSTVGLTASLSGCSASTPATGFSVLRAGDIAFLRALIPVVLEGAVPSEHSATVIDTTLHGIDQSLSRFSPEMFKLTQQLFDVVDLGVTRGPLTGVWRGWEHASADEVKAFLTRWQNSAISLLHMGHNALLQLVMLAWYGQANAWGHCGYPGPPTV